METGFLTILVSPLNVNLFKSQNNKYVLNYIEPGNKFIAYSKLKIVYTRDTNGKLQGHSMWGGQ